MKSATNAAPCSVPFASRGATKLAFGVHPNAGATENGKRPAKMDAHASIGTARNAARPDGGATTYPPSPRTSRPAPSLLWLFRMAAAWYLKIRCRPRPVSAVSVIGNGLCSSTSTSLRRDPLPSSPSTSSTKIPDTLPVTIPTFQRSWLSSNLRTCPSARVRRTETSDRVSNHYAKNCHFGSDPTRSRGVVRSCDPYVFVCL